MSVRDTIRKTKPTVVEYTLKDGGKIWVRALSGTGRAKYSAYCEKAKENGGIHAEAVAAMGICEEDGTLVYNFEKKDDISEIADQLDGADIDAIGLKMFEISGLTQKAQDEAAKN